MIEAIVYGDDDDEGKYVRKILSEYRNKRHLYEEFRGAVHKLLDATLKENNYKYQIVSRTKTLERLREKLLRKAATGKRYRTIDDIEDLSGIRVLFYSESDKEKFVREFKKEMDGPFHLKEKKEKNGYEATHIVMALGPKRLELSEYRHFSGLKAEIQATSLLCHTWAEIEHDFIYKDVTGLAQRDPAKFAVLKRKLGDVLNKHIKRASAEFEEIIKWAEE